MRLHLIWGCNPDYQYENAWLRFLIRDCFSNESSWFTDSHLPPDLSTSELPILVESGLIRLERSPSRDRLAALSRQRSSRLTYLSNRCNFGIFHLSDEQGADADTWYHNVSSNIPVWRNFYHPHLNDFHKNILTFPIGPRSLFLDQLSQSSLTRLSSKRKYPWSFMGTVWKGSSRMLAVSVFLRSLPSGFYFGGKSFGQGLDLPDYMSKMKDSVFTLCPEGDRHLDTFRLWETLCSGSIPLIVDKDTVAHNLIPADFPVPVFTSWEDACSFAISYLSDPFILDALQKSVFSWWLLYISSLQARMHSSLCIGNKFLQ